MISNHYYGPMGTIPDDWYRLRKTAVVIREPKYRHTYSAAIMFIDTQTGYGLYHFGIQTSINTDFPRIPSDSRAIIREFERWISMAW
jgi:hypothetical protein